MSEDNILTSPRLIGRRLLLSRRDMGWSQEELGKRSGVSRGHIAKIERSEVNNPTLDVIYRLADTLGISRAYFLGFSEDPLHEVSERNDETDSFSQNIQSTTKYTSEVELLELFRNLNFESKQILLTIAGKLKEADSR